MTGVRAFLNRLDKIHFGKRYTANRLFLRGRYRNRSRTVTRHLDGPGGMTATNLYAKKRNDCECARDTRTDTRAQWREFRNGRVERLIQNAGRASYSNILIFLVKKIIKSKENKP